MDKQREEIINSLRNGVKSFIHRWTPPTDDRDSSLFKISRHHDREFMFVVKGTCRYFFNESVYETTPGTLVLVDPWIPHGDWYTAADHDLIHMWGLLSEDELYTNIVVVDAPDSARFILNLSSMPLPLQLNSFFNKRLAALEKLGSYTTTNIENYLKPPLNMFLDEAALELERLPEKRTNKYLTDKIKSYIRSKNGRDCSLAILERISGFSRYHLAHCFQHDTGTTIGAYINTVRLNFTIVAMQRGMRQKEIAEELGFSSLNSFWNWKKQYSDLLPRKRETK